MCRGSCGDLSPGGLGKRRTWGLDSWLMMDYLLSCLPRSSCGRGDILLKVVVCEPVGIARKKDADGQTIGSPLDTSATWLCDQSIFQLE